MQEQLGAPTRVSSVHSIDHFALNVPSIESARHFFTAFGLDVRLIERAEKAELELRALDGHRWARILPSNEKSLAYLSFSCYEGDLEAIEDQIRSAGGRLMTDVPAAIGPECCSPGGLWFADLDGNMIHVGVGRKTTPSAKGANVSPAIPADVRGAYPRSEAKLVRPRRMSHVLLFTPDVPRAVAFYQQALGLGLSDKSIDIIAFMHAVHGSDHHLLAFAKSTAKGWHHVAWDVKDINDIGVGANQMVAAGYAKGWGTGRHVLGSNYFHYVMDPWGSFSEYSADIDFISAGKPWMTGDFPPEDSLYLWGPDVPPFFIHNTEA